MDKSIAGEDLPTRPNHRTEVLARVAEGAPLGTADLAVIFDISRAHAHRLAAQGAFDQFRLKGRRIGTRHYSGVLVSRYLQGEATMTFAAPRAARRKK